MNTYFDELDTLSSDEREFRLFSNLPQQLGEAVQRIPLLAKHLEGCDVSSVVDRSTLQKLPVLRKETLMEFQRQDPPFGGFVDLEGIQGGRVFMSPGPVWEPQVSGLDPWQAARCLHAVGIRAGDIVHNAFSYHLTPGGFILDEGAKALGCIVFPAGVGNTEAQVEALVQLSASAYIGTPDFLQSLLNRAAEVQQSLPKLKRALVSGGALFPNMRQAYLDQGIHVQQAYATADLGVIAYETSTDNQIHPGMVVNEHLIVEIVRPGTGEPLAVDQVGELVVTRLHPDYPLVRFATGDLSKLLPEASPCGRTQMRLAGWMGRADQRTKVKGMFVDPQQIDDIRRAHPEIQAARLIVGRKNDMDTMTLHVKTDLADDVINLQAIEDSVKSILKIKGEVVNTNTPFANDGLVIEDTRDFES
ncbi:MAG: AMP-binding protein [Gammaproteobacteria bacterium]|nr:AMP-binding protein [Gammaproteobacteria bacterium]